MLRPQVNGKKLINAFTDDRRKIPVKFFCIASARLKPRDCNFLLYYCVFHLFATKKVKGLFKTNKKNCKVGLLKQSTRGCQVKMSKERGIS